MKKRLSPRCVLLCLPAIALLVATRSEAVTIFQSDFTTPPANLALAGGTGATAGYNNNGPGGSTALELADTGSGSAVATLDFGLAFPAFDTSAAGQSVIRLTADFAVTTMSATASSASIPRILFRNTANPAQGLTLGLGRTGANNLILYAAKGDNATPAAADRVVLFNYGTYDSTVGNEAVNDTNDAYVRIAIEYFNGSDTMSVAAYNGATLLGSGTIAGFSGTSFSNSNLDVLFATGTGGLATAYFDNVLIETVPEPASMCLFSLGLLPLLRRRR